jgi:hypothetical protein
VETLDEEFREREKERNKMDEETHFRWRCMLQSCCCSRHVSASILMNLFPLSQRSLRFVSTETPSAAKKVGGAGLFQRLSSFVVGAGVTALATQYFIYEEVKEGNKLMLLKQQELEVRLTKLEKKK